MTFANKNYLLLQLTSTYITNSQLTKKNAIGFVRFIDLDTLSFFSTAQTIVIPWNKSSCTMNTKNENMNNET